MPTAQTEPMNANGEAERFIHPRWAAQATTAGAVNDRKPATIPMQNARNRVSAEFIVILQCAPNVQQVATPSAVIDRRYSSKIALIERVVSPLGRSHRLQLKTAETQRHRERLQKRIS